MSKVGRNDPCPCGSGKKYKKCCAFSTFKRKIQAVDLTQHGGEKTKGLFKKGTLENSADKGEES
ncbi:MAG: SEC-C metal-binding domain-containing protein [Simkaniaceae bacterium]